MLVVSASARPADVINSISAGAAGYVTKHADTDMLLSAVRTVASGGFALSAQLADILQARLGTAEREPAIPPARDAGLSPREEQTLDLIAKGFTHAQVARRMGISKATVDTYVERIRGKLQVGNKAELTRGGVTAAVLAAVAEALTNVGKHTGVRSAVLWAALSEVGLEISVLDHGAGFGRAMAARGMGLTQSIGERIHEVGGRVSVDSRPGDGTCVEITIPVAALHP